MELIAAGLRPRLSQRMPGFYLSPPLSATMIHFRGAAGHVMHSALSKRNSFIMVLVKKSYHVIFLISQ